MKQIRTTLGLSQSEMAMLLQIPRITWAMYETGRRSLPVAVMEKLNAIVLLLPQQPANIAPVSRHRKAPAKMMERLKSDRKETGFTLLKTQHALDKMQTTFTARHTMLQLITAMQTNTYSKKLMDGTLELPKIISLEKIAQNDEHQQLLLQYKIRSLQAQQRMIDEMMEELEKI